MSLLTSFIPYDIKSVILTFLFGYIVYYLVKFYIKVRSFPPGPFPWPFIGTVHQFLLTGGEHWSIKFEKLAQKYGPMMTVWVGSKPMVMINDIDLARDVMRKNDFAGRPEQFFSFLITDKKNNSTDIIFADYGHEWEALRRVAHSAVMKYSTTDKLAYLVSDCVDHTIKTMLETEGFDKPFVPFEYIYNMFLNILSASAFGKRYDSFEDPEYKSIKYVHRDFITEVDKRIIFWEMFPITRKLDKYWEKGIKSFDEHKEFLRNKLTSHYEDYNESITRDFCDTLIAAKNEALSQGKESVPYLTDHNLALTLFDLIFAGTDTSQQTFRWILFYMLILPEMQQKLREEIESQIGDRIPTHEDRNRCHYTMAFISESLRIRSIVPMSVQHKAVVTSKIGDYTIPKGTVLSVFQGNILHDPKNWSFSEQFRPERFLENGKHVTTRPKAWIPFGVGRRVCLGEKLAIADLFLVFVRLLQKTADYELVFHFEGDSKPQLNPLTEVRPKEFKISFKRK